MKIKARNSQILISICAVILLLLIDQLVKSFITINMDLHQQLTVIKDFFWIRLVHNPGAAFSILEGEITFFIIATIIALVVFSFMFLTTKDNINQIGLTMMIGGTLGNAIDRLRLGYVIDYLDFNLFGYPFPVFNFADIMLTLGVVVLCFGMIREYMVEKDG
ncbi:MAG: signal peptidase II [Erysipelotrichaceae bacterium]|nr:signal peptidase II [Erysipelotrichaceae bacterium]